MLTLFPALCLQPLSMDMDSPTLIQFKLKTRHNLHTSPPSPKAVSPVLTGVSALHVMELGLADTFQSLSWHFHSTWHSRMFFFIELSLLLFLINVFPWFFSSYLLPHFLLRHCTSPNYWCNGDVLSLVPSSCHSAHGPWAILPTPVAVTSTCHWLPNIFYLQKILQRCWLFFNFWVYFPP